MTVSNILKYIFILHFIVAMAFGIWFFIAVETWETVAAWPWLDPYAGRVIGAMTIAWAMASALGYRAASWEQVEIIVIQDVIGSVLLLVGSVWMMFAYPTIPIAGWLMTGLFGLFVVLFLYAYLTKP
ncbi:MAG: hypothetical protein ACE5H4_06680 [Candidatus Thorarchaeota archaeon]